MPTALIADDDRVIRTLLRSMLEERGFDVIEAASGAEAIERARTDFPDVLLLDMEMPGMSGLGVLDELRRDPALARLPVVVLSGHTGEAVIAGALARGATDYLIKPPDPDDLSRRLDHVAQVKTAQDSARRVVTPVADGAPVDARTGLATRRVIEEALTQAKQQARERARPLGLVLFELLGLHDLERRLGRLGVDEALVQSARRVTTGARRAEAVGLWQDGVIAVVTGGAPAAVEDLANDLRAVLREPVNVRGSQESLSVATGWASWVPGGELHALSDRAQAALRAARSGAGVRGHVLD